MIINFETEESDEDTVQTIFVFDGDCNPIDCIEYDTETQEVTMHIPVRSRLAAQFKMVPMQQWVEGGEQPFSHAEPIVLCFKVPGSYAMDATGQRL